MATNLNKLFVFVSNNNVDSFISAHLDNTSDSYAKKIAFLGGTGEIMTHGQKFAINSNADVSALKEKIGSGTLNSSLSAETIIAAINEVYEITFNNQQTIGDNTAGLVKDVATLNSSVNGLETSVTTINSSVNTLETNATTVNSSVSSLETTINLLTANAQTTGSIDQKIAQAKKEILTGDSIEDISAAYDTILEIAQWIENDQTGAAAMANKINTLSSSVGNSSNGGTDTASGLFASIDSLQSQIDSMTGGAGSISTQIENALNELDSSVSLAGATAADPATVTKDSSIEVLGGIKIVETDGLLDSTNSTSVVLKADAAGAAAAVYDVLLGTAQDDSTNNTILGLKNEIAGITISATGETGDSSLIQASAENNTVTVTSTQKLQDAVALAETALQGLTVTTADDNVLSVTGSPVSKNAAQLTFTPHTGDITVDGSVNTLKYADGDANKLVTVGNIVTAINDIDMWEEITNA